MFVLSYVMPPNEGAKYGKATVNEPVPYKARAAKTEAVRVLVDHGVARDEARKYGLGLVMAPTGESLTHHGTGIAFRVDHADRTPNACGCCGRLVLPSDHALAGSDDAYCLGCFTWDRNSEPCLSENTAHAENEEN